MMMRHVGLLVAAAALFGFSARAETVDAIVATVGTEVILHSELMQELAPVLNDLRKSAASEEDFNAQAEKHMGKALEQAIEYKILLREALLAGLEVPDDKVEERINDIKKRFGSSEEFMKELERAGETMSDFRNRMKKQILAISMGMRKRKDFEKTVEVTEADVADFYAKNPEKFTHPERVRVRRIFLPAGSAAGERVQVRARMEELKKQLDNGADFAELAKTFSSGPDAEQGGMLGWVGRADLVEDLENVAFSLEEGGVSGVVETEYGFAILKVEKKEDAGTASLDDARTMIEPQLRALRADEAYGRWMNELRKRSRVKIFI